MTSDTESGSLYICNAIWWGAAAAVKQWKFEEVTSSGDRRPTDRQLVMAAHSGILDNATFIGFAKRYRVFRHPLHLIEHRDERIGAVTRALHAVYSVAPEPISPGALSNMWLDAIGAVHKAMQPFGPTAELRSMCMKALWLYQPAHATMWDSYAVIGLNRITNENRAHRIRQQHNVNDFLDRFENVFALHQDTIIAAIENIESITSEHYAYRRRVLDKALWFMGANRQAGLNEINGIIQLMPELARASEPHFPVSTAGGLISSAGR